MAATASKNKPASKVAEQAKAAQQAERIQIVGDVFAWFGWKTKHPSPPITDNEASEVDAFLYDCENDRLGTIPTPPAIWRFVDLPSRIEKHFRTRVDAMALATALMPDSGKYFEWLAEQGEPSEYMCAGSVADLPSGTQTPYGAVFAELKGETASIWFGRKAGQEPALSGSAAVDAVKCLFDIAASPAPTGKTKQPKMVAKKEGTKPDADSAKDAESRTTRRSESATLQKVPLRLIQPAKENHRKTFDKAALTELADSIKAHGVLQPLLLRPLQDGSNFFVIIAGERRYRAALMAGLKEVPAQIVEREGVSESLAMLHENIMRVDLNPIERAQAIRRLMDEHSLSQKEVGQMVGCQQGQISNELRLLNLPESLQALVASGEIAPTLIRVVLPYCDLTDVMTDLAKTIAKQFKENAERVFEARDLENWLKTAIVNHSRPMKQSSWSEWSNPSPKERHFKTVSDADMKELAPRKIDLLHEWEGKDRTFNVKKFGELNAKPLASRREKHRLYKEQRGQSSGQKEKTSTAAKPFEREYMVKQALEDSLAPLLADVLESAKDSEKVRTVCTALLVVCGGMGEAITGKGYGDEVLPELLKTFAVTQKELDKLLRLNLVAEMRRGIHLDAKECMAIARFLGVELLQLWKPTDELLESLTDHGRELLAAAAGSVPEFLLPFFGIEPKKPAKAKKAKAA